MYYFIVILMLLLVFYAGLVVGIVKTDEEWHESYLRNTGSKFKFSKRKNKK